MRTDWIRAKRSVRTPGNFSVSSEAEMLLVNQGRKLSSVLDPFSWRCHLDIKRSFLEVSPGTQECGQG